MLLCIQILFNSNSSERSVIMWKTTLDANTCIVDVWDTEFRCHRHLQFTLLHFAVWHIFVTIEVVRIAKILELIIRYMPCGWIWLFYPLHFDLNWYVNVEDDGTRSALACLSCLCLQSGWVQKHNPSVWGERGDSQPGSQGPGHDGSYPLWLNWWHPTSGMLLWLGMASYEDCWEQVRRYTFIY